MYIYATIDESTGKVLGYEITNTPKQYDNTHKNFLIRDSLPAQDFYEGFDGYRFRINEANEWVLEKIDESTVNKKRCFQNGGTASDLTTDQGIENNIATAIVNLPWFIERTNVISNFSVL